MSDNNSYVRSWKSMESYPAVDAFLRGCMQNYGSKAVDRVKVLYIIRLYHAALWRRRRKKERKKQFPPYDIYLSLI